MLIREVMNSNPTVVEDHTSLGNAYELMQKNGFRHLPVMKDKKLIGIVTDRDLRLATSRLSSRPFKPETPVSEVMSRPVRTAGADDPIGGAIKLMRETKIGCLPVMKHDALIGMVTSMDLLDAMLILMGLNRPSGRLDVRLTDHPGALARLTALLSGDGVNIHSILSYFEKDGRMRIVLRVNNMEIRPIAAMLCREKIDVLWPPHIVCPE
jgi:acetoin utilization protein AcuB